MKNLSNLIITHRSQHIRAEIKRLRSQKTAVVRDDIDLFVRYTRNDLVRSWAVFYEIPQGRSKTSANARAQIKDGILYHLQQSHLVHFFLNITGKAEEKLLFIVNPTYRDTERFAHKFNYAEFLFARCRTEKGRDSICGGREYDTAVENDIEYRQGNPNGDDYICTKHAHIRHAIPWNRADHQTDGALTLQYNGTSTDDDCGIESDGLSPFHFPIEATIRYAQYIIESQYGYIGLNKFVPGLIETLDENRTLKSLMIKRAELYATRLTRAKRLRAQAKSILAEAEELEQANQKAPQITQADSTLFL